MKTKVIFVFSAVAVCLAASAATYKVDLDRPEGLYRCGETAVFTVTLLSTNNLSVAKSPCAKLDNFGTSVLANMPFDVVTTGVAFTVTGTLGEPGFLRLSLPPTKDGGKDPFVFSAGFEPEKIRKGSPSPDDFDEFWAEARARLAREVPLDPQVVLVPERSTSDFDFYRVSFATFGRRVHGYMSVPTDKSKSPFPVDFGVNAAGFGGWTNDMKGEKDSIRVQFSVYPFPPDWKWKESGLEAAYKAMDAEAKAKYGSPRYCQAGIAESREDYFFYPVVLGIDRAVDWVASRPDVDRSRFRYEGTSQGGGFGLYLCGLNHAFTKAALYVPAITDTMGYLKGRESGWPKIVENNSSTPERRAAAEKWAPYFDGANFASRITCPVRVAVGFSDTTCPPCAVYAAYNEIKVKDKEIGNGIGMTHSCSGRFYSEFGHWAKSSSTVVAFKDAAKIKSWDAWNDHKKPEPPKEKPCVTWKKLNKLDPGLKEIGRIAVRGAKDIKSSKWSVGCETMDRDYADWNAYKHLLEPLGAKHGRLFSGWAKTEQEKGRYDFTWLDPQVREMAAMGVKPWICLSYGNPVYGSDFRLGMRVKQVTENAEAFEAWLRYCTACVERYKDVVDEWEIWNEPFGQGPEYAEMFYRTARAIRAVQPTAKCFCTAITYPGDYKCVLEKLKENDALDLGSYFIYHPYDANPDYSYAKRAEPLRKLVKSYSGAFDIMQGEVGCPAQLEFAHALHSIEWTEYSQAKWDLRRAIGDASRSIPSSLFTMIDLQYTFMLQSFGLVRSNTLKEFVYRRPSYFAMQNVYSVFDDDMLPQRHTVVKTDGRDMACHLFTRLGQSWRFYWFSGERPDSGLSFTPVTLDIPERLERPVWVDMITGRVFEIPADSVSWKKGVMTIKGVPMWDSPVAVVSRRAVTLARDWQKTSPKDIVDSFYRPGQYENRMKAFPGPHTNDAWLSMSTAEFLPCIDRYGQFRHRDWPGKTKSDDDLRRAAEEEERDLAANPGPKDRDRFGGWKDGPQLEATGRFRTHRDGRGKWWLVDPDGRLFWSFGPVRVSASSGMTPMNGDNSTPRTGVATSPRDCFFAELPPAPDAPDATPFSKFWTTHDDLLWPFFLARGETRVYDFSSANLYRKYGEGYYEKFSDLVHRRLRSWGANTIANSSDLAICIMDRTPYAERVECQSRPIAGSHGMWWKFRDPWDESFAKGVTAALEAHGLEAHDPWCIGFFVDNEINWGGPSDLAKWILQSPSDQPAKAAFADWLEKAYGSFPALGEKWGHAYADRADFMGSVALPGEGAKDDLYRFSCIVIDEYFRRTREAVKAFDPQLLYLGCRFAGRARDEVAAACARHCDVVSYNIYRETIDDWRLPGGIDAPVMIGEFHFGATDRGPFGTGCRQADDQVDRAEKMKGYVRSALANPLIVGVHWHQFSDQATSGRFDGEYLQVGWTDICDTPYPEAVSAVRELGEELYRSRNR